MTKKVYQCQVCGSIFEVLQVGAGSLSCCGAALQFWVQGPLEAHRERAPFLDLNEIMVNGESSWQYAQPGECVYGIPAGAQSVG